MKTPQQKKYERLITSIIKSNAYVMERRRLLDDFLEDCELFYDLFCEKIYDFFEERTKGTLFVDESGRVHINPKARKAHHVYFEVLSDVDYMEMSEDVVDYINLALKRLEAQVRTVLCAVQA